MTPAGEDDAALDMEAASITRAERRILELATDDRKWWWARTIQKVGFGIVFASSVFLAGLGVTFMTGPDSAPLPPNWPPHIPTPSEVRFMYGILMLAESLMFLAFLAVGVWFFVYVESVRDVLRRLARPGAARDGQDAGAEAAGFTGRARRVFELVTDDRKWAHGVKVAVVLFGCLLFTILLAAWAAFELFSSEAGSGVVWSIGFMLAVIFLLTIVILLVLVVVYVRTIKKLVRKLVSPNVQRPSVRVNPAN